MHLNVLLYSLHAWDCISLWIATLCRNLRISVEMHVVACTHLYPRWASPFQLACSLSMIDRIFQSLNCLTNAYAFFPFISFPTSQISHLRPWEIQYLKCEVYCLAEWKAVDATDNCYRQKDNYRSFGALSNEMTCLCEFRFKSLDLLCALLAVPFLQGIFLMPDLVS